MLSRKHTIDTHVSVSRAVLAGNAGLAAVAPAVKQRRGRRRICQARQIVLCGALLLTVPPAVRAQTTPGKGDATVTGAPAPVTQPSAGPAVPAVAAKADAPPPTPAHPMPTNVGARSPRPAAKPSPRPAAKQAQAQHASLAHPARQDEHKARQQQQRLHEQRLAQLHAEQAAHQHALQVAHERALKARQQAQQQAQQQHARQVATQQAQQQHSRQVATQQTPQQSAAPPSISQAGSVGHPEAASQPIPMGATAATIGNSAPGSGAPGATTVTPRATAQHPGAQSGEPATGPLSQTKPDFITSPHSASADHPLDSPLTAVGDAWKMVAYMVPMLGVIVGSLHLLRRFQQRTGRLPAPIQSAARFNGVKNRQQTTTEHGGLLGLMVSGRQHPRTQPHGAIRLVETVPIGGTNLHLVEVHGRMLLLGAAGGNVSLLTEFEEKAGIKDDDFRVLLRAAAADMDVLDLSEPDLPATTMVTALEEMLQETGEAVTRRMRRLRTVSDYEAGEDVHA